MQTGIFYGGATALVTPFRAGHVDFPALEALIDRQIQGKTDALVALGTTGEPASLREGERAEIVECAKEKCSGHIPLIVGAGSNDTKTAIRLAREAERLGADALLIVTPYYNRASDAGLIAHFTAIADRVNVPVIVYNVPSRTGVRLKAEVVRALSEHPMIRAIKQADSSVQSMAEMIRICGDRLAVYCGNDDMILPAMALGARGAISVAGNLVPERIAEMTRAGLGGDFERARKEQSALAELIRLLGAEVNPIPVKAALSMMRLIEDELRLPLVPLEDEKRAPLKAELEKLNLL